jgi:hypothetical protein
MAKRIGESGSVDARRGMRACRTTLGLASMVRLGGRSRSGASNPDVAIVWGLEPVGRVALALDVAARAVLARAPMQIRAPFRVSREGKAKRSEWSG